MAAKKRTVKKKLQPTVKVPKWKTVARNPDIKYVSISFSELKEWIKNCVPVGTPDEEIRLNFDISQDWGYYDDVVVESTMELQILEK
jgi:hypothetical protein